MDRYEWCGVESGSEIRNVSGRGEKQMLKWEKKNLQAENEKLKKALSRKEMDILKEIIRSRDKIPCRRGI